MSKLRKFMCRIEWHPTHLLRTFETMDGKNKIEICEACNTAYRQVFRIWFFSWYLRIKHSDYVKYGLGDWK